MLLNFSDFDPGVIHKLFLNLIGIASFEYQSYMWSNRS